MCAWVRICERMRVCMCMHACMQKKISELTYLFISRPHFRGHGTSRKLHHFSLCLSSSFFLMRVPHAQTISRSSQTSWCWSSSALFTFLLHLPHDTSSWSHRLTWFLASSRGNSFWHQRHCPFSKFSMLPAKRFLQNDDTGILHNWQALSLPWVLKHSTQNPQKLWPHGVAISASRTGFLLDIKRNPITNLLKRWYTIRDHYNWLVMLYLPDNTQVLNWQITTEINVIEHIFRRWVHFGSNFAQSWFVTDRYTVSIEFRYVIKDLGQSTLFFQNSNRDKGALPNIISRAVILTTTWTLFPYASDFRSLNQQSLPMNELAAEFFIQSLLHKNDKIMHISVKLVRQTFVQ